jgi:hypothetical protein
MDLVTGAHRTCRLNWSKTRYPRTNCDWAWPDVPAGNAVDEVFLVPAQTGKTVERLGSRLRGSGDFLAEKIGHLWGYWSFFSGFVLMSGWVKQYMSSTS